MQAIPQSITIGKKLYISISKSESSQCFEKESINNINEDIQKACLSKDSQRLDYQTGENLSLDFICWHQDYNYIKFDYEIIHSDGSATTDFFWLDYEGCKLMAVNEEIK